jgi:hypothetical protein
MAGSPGQDVGAAAKNSLNNSYRYKRRLHLYEKQNTCYIFRVAESDLHDLRRAAARQKERTGKSPLRRFAHNPKRELRQGGKFFTPNGRNPLKNQESKK